MPEKLVRKGSASPDRPPGPVDLDLNKVERPNDFDLPIGFTGPESSHGPAKLNEGNEAIDLHNIPGSTRKTEPPIDNSDFELPPGFTDRPKEKQIEDLDLILPRPSRSTGPDNGKPPVPPVIWEAPKPIPKAPSPVKPPEQQKEEPETFESVLDWQKEAFSRRRDMIAFRHGKKVGSLARKDQIRYMELRDGYYMSRQTWLEGLAKLPEQEREELKGMTKLKEVEARCEKLKTEIIVPTILKDALRERELELVAIDAEIAEMERLLTYDQDTKRSITALGNQEDLKELKTKRRRLSADITEVKAGLPEQTPPGQTPPRVPAQPQPAQEVPKITPPGEGANPLAHEQTRAEARGKSRDTLQGGINELDRRMEAKKQEMDGLPAWNAIARLRCRRELNQMARDKRRLEEELAAERPGFGARFRDAVVRKYRAVRNSLKGNDESFLLADTATPAPEEAVATPPAPAERSDQTAPEGAHEKHNGTWARWVGQRALSTLTFGFWDFHKAQKFRLGVKNTARETEVFAAQIQKESHLSLEDALAEAQQIETAFARAGREGTTGVSAKRIEKVSQEITARKVHENNVKIDEIIIGAITSLENRLKKYKGDSGQEVLTDEAKSKIAIDLQKRLTDARNTYIEIDAKEVAKMMRETIDPEWWHRYVYAPFEAALAASVLYVGAQVIGSKIAAAKAGGAATQEATKIALKDTIWAEAKRQLVTHGVTNPTNAQVQQVAIQFAKDSGVKVVAKGGELVWQQTVGGVLKDVVLGKGFMVHIAGGLKTIASIKSAALAAAL